jgi:RNase P subunit RPR2
MPTKEPKPAFKASTRRAPKALNGSPPPTPTDAPRILTLDLELSPLVVYTWGVRDQFINLDALIQDWSILAFAAKWYGEKKVIYHDTSGRGADKVRDDRPLLAELAPLLDAADIVVGHHVKGFDLKKLSSRMIEHGMPPHSPVRVIDTLTAARRAGAFSSNKLAYLAEKLTTERKDSHSAYPGMALWKACLADDPKAWKVMRAYNIQDVQATEELYTTLRPWIVNHPNVTIFADTGEQACPKCSSPLVQTRGIVTTQSGKFQRLHCQACGSWSRAKQNLIPADFRKTKLTSI